MNISQKGIDLIKEFEGLRLEAYRCPAGIPTIGYGTTKGVEMGIKITKDEAERLLKKDIEQFENGVLSRLRVKVNQNQFDALVSFAYNVGLGNFSKSNLLRLLNGGQPIGNIAKEFLKWNKAGGKILKGLSNRRDAEMKLFIST